MTQFRCLRGFRFEGVDHAQGALLDLSDDQARSLIWMANTIEPILARDRQRVKATPACTWESPEEAKHSSIVGRLFGTVRPC